MGARTSKKKGVKKDMVEKRKRATGPLNLDALSNYIAHARAVEHYKAMAIPVYNINQMVNNNAFRKVVHHKTKGAGNHILSKWVENVASERTSLENSVASRILGVLRRNAVVSALGLNIVTALKQPLSLSLGLAENPKMWPLMFKAMSEALMSPKQFKKYVWDRSTVVPHRNMEREMREMSRRRRVKRQIMGKRSLSEKALFFLRIMDNFTVLVTWKAAYNMSLENTGDEAQAAQYADSVIERTQPMADIMDLPHFFRGGELEKALTLFQNQINQNYNYWAHDILGATKRGEISKEMAAYRVLTGIFLPAMMLGLITRGFTPGDPEEWAKDLASFMISPIFIFGRLASSVINGYDPTGLTGFDFAGEVYDAAISKSPEDKAIHLLGAGAKAGGIPWSQPKRTIKGVIELDNPAFQDPRVLIWSKYALQQDEGEGKRGGRERRRRKARRRRSR
jgi:hypothetical protein